jgi:arsenate reductase
MRDGRYYKQYAPLTKAQHPTFNSILLLFMQHKILYICTHNRCRSILAEAVTRHLAADQIIAASAGSSPVEQVHPLSLQYLAKRDISTQDLHSQSWHEFENFHPNLIVTLCDQAAADTCPVWFGSGLSIHWGLEDPSRVIGSEKEIAQAFNATIDLLVRVISQVVEKDTQHLSQTQFAEYFKQLTE